jgi:hypothetical protein
MMGSGDGYRPDDFPYPISLTFERHPPPPVPLAAVAAAAAAAGALGGWMIVAWTLHRYRRHTAGRKAMIVKLGLPPLAFMCLAEILTLPFLAQSALKSIPTGLIPAAAMDVLPPFAWIPGTSAIVGAIAVAAVLAIAVAALPTSDLPGPHEAPAT